MTRVKKNPSTYWCYRLDTKGVCTLYPCKSHRKTREKMAEITPPDRASWRTTKTNSVGRIFLLMTRSEAVSYVRKWSKPKSYKKVRSIVVMEGGAPCPA